MAKGAYVGINNVARKIKKGYVGVNGVARKIKKAYIGIGGVARPCWGGGLEYYGEITPLSTIRENLAATTVGNYALFGGGGYGDGKPSSPGNYPTVRATVDAYDTSLTRVTPTELSEAREGLAATTVGNYALFGGGHPSDTSEASYKDATNIVDAYDLSLTRTLAPTLVLSVYALAATTVGNYALFGGGGNYATRYGLLTAYEASLTKINVIKSFTGRDALAATTVGDYALFGGGRAHTEIVNQVNALSASLTMVSVSSLSSARLYLAATTINNYALFGGGQGSDVVDAYDTSLTRTLVSPLSEAEMPAATTVRDYALFGYNHTIDAYDQSLTRTTLTDTGVRLGYADATTIGNYALFCGNNYEAYVKAYVTS